MEMKEAALRFMDNISFEIAQRDERLEGAIRASMGAGNPKGSHVKPNDQFKKAIENRLNTFLADIMNGSITREKYDEAFYKTVSLLESDARELDGGCSVSFGRFQKIINIWIKYHVALAYSECDEEQFGTYRDLLPVAHIPVDSYVLGWLVNWLEKNDCDNPALAELKGITSWKWGMSEAQYRTLQNAARAISAGLNYASPLELEMREDIWSNVGAKTRRGGICQIF